MVRFREMIRPRCAVVFALLMAGVFVPASARADDPHWIKDAKTGCAVHNSFPQPGETVSWSGACKGGYASGKGTLRWFKDGLPGNVYQGEYRNGFMEGRGLINFAGGGSYDGEWHADDKQGHGLQRYPAGDVYDGGWSGNKRSGMATYTWLNGKYYVGSYDNDLPTKGTLYSADGSSCPTYYDKATGRITCVSGGVEVSSGPSVHERCTKSCDFQQSQCLQRVNEASGLAIADTFIDSLNSRGGSPGGPSAPAAAATEESCNHGYSLCIGACP